MSIRGIIMCFVVVSSNVIHSRAIDVKLLESTPKSMIFDVFRNASCQAEKFKRDVIREFVEASKKLTTNANNHKIELFDRTEDIIQQVRANVSDHEYQRWRYGNYPDIRITSTNCSQFFDKMNVHRKKFMNESSECIERNRDRLAAELIRKWNSFEKDDDNSGKFFRDNSSDCDERNIFSTIDVTEISESVIRHSTDFLSDYGRRLSRQKEAHSTWIRNILGTAEFDFRLCRRGFGALGRQARTVIDLTLQCIDKMNFEKL